MLPKKWEELQGADIVITIFDDKFQGTWETHEVTQVALARGVVMCCMIHTNCPMVLPDPLPPRVFVARWSSVEELQECHRQLMAIFAEVGVDELALCGDVHATYQRRTHAENPMDT